MSRNFFPSFLIFTALAGSLAIGPAAFAGPLRVTRTTQWTYGPCQQPSAPETGSASNRVVYKVLQQTPQYDVRRPEVPSGARITLFANFLGQNPGYVLFDLNRTATQCEVIDWKQNSVTAELPRLGLLEPKNAELRIVLPDGRVAKTFRVLFVSQPDIMVHEETVPLPMPPSPAAETATYAASVPGGLLLYADR